jgi:hypothetical protein
VSDRGQKAETIILEERTDMGLEPNEGGSCEVTNEITLAGVFGQYTSLKTGIRIMFPCDPAKFEAEAERYHSRVVTAIQKFQNKVLAATGRGPVWQGPDPAQQQTSPPLPGVSPLTPPDSRRRPRRD